LNHVESCHDDIHGKAGINFDFDNSQHQIHINCYSDGKTLQCITK